MSVVGFQNKCDRACVDGVSSTHGGGGGWRKTICKAPNSFDYIDIPVNINSGYVIIIMVKMTTATTMTKATARTQ